MFPLFALSPRPSVTPAHVRAFLQTSVDCLLRASFHARCWWRKILTNKYKWYNKGSLEVSTDWSVVLKRTIKSTRKGPARCVKFLLRLEASLAQQGMGEKQFRQRKKRTQ